MKKTYKDVGGWFGFEEFYKTTVVNYLKSGMNVVEMGVFEGKSVCFLAEHIKTTGLSIKLYAVDKWSTDEEYNKFLQNMKECEVLDYIIPVRMNSDIAAATFPDNYFDVIFIDGDHGYQSVRDDIVWWYPKLKPGGLFAGDDYVECWSDVMKAVDDHFGTEALKQFPAWYLWKK